MNEREGEITKRFVVLHDDLREPRVNFVHSLQLQLDFTIQHLFIDFVRQVLRIQEEEKEEEEEEDMRNEKIRKSEEKKKKKKKKKKRKKEEKKKRRKKKKRKKEKKNGAPNLQNVKGGIKVLLLELLWNSLKNLIAGEVTLQWSKALLQNEKTKKNKEKKDFWNSSIKNREFPPRPRNPTL